MCGLMLKGSILGRIQLGWKRSVRPIQPHLPLEGVCTTGKSPPTWILIRLQYSSGLGISYWGGNSACVSLLVLSNTHTHTRMHTHACPVVLSEVQPEVSPRSRFVPSKTRAAVERLRSALRSGTRWTSSRFLRPRWFTLVPLAFPECRSACLCAEVLALASIESGDYSSSLHLGNMPCARACERESLCGFHCLRRE